MRRYLAIILFVALPVFADYLGEIQINDYVDFSGGTFSVTGQNTIADASPEFEVYEGGTAETVLSSGKMERRLRSLYNANYYGRFQATTAAGYEAGKAYVVCCSAEVNSVSAITFHHFRVIDPTDFMADVSLLATETNVDANETKIDTANNVLDNFAFTGTDVNATLDGETVTVGTNNDKTGYGLAANAITASVIDADAIGASEIAANAIGSSEIADAAITAAKLATDSITSDEIASTAVTEIQSGLSTLTAANLASATEETAARVWAVSGRELSTPNNYKADVSALATTAGMITLIASATGDVIAALPSANAIADQVWDEAISGHAGAGSTGATLSAASAPSAASVADAVWDEALSGHSTSGTTGKKLTDVPLSGTGDWTSDEKAGFRYALGIDGATGTLETWGYIYKILEQVRSR